RGRLRGLPAGEQAIKRRLTAPASLFREHNRLSLAHRVENETLLVESAHRGPVERFPRAPDRKLTIVPLQRQKHQRQNRLVDQIDVNLRITHRQTPAETANLQQPVPFFMRFSPDGYASGRHYR